MQQSYILHHCFTIISSDTFTMKISWNLSSAMIMYAVQFWKKLSKEGEKADRAGSWQAGSW